MKNNSLKVAKNVTNDDEAVEVIIKSLASLLTIGREILEKGGEINDEGTNSKMSDINYRTRKKHLDDAGVFG